MREKKIDWKKSGKEYEKYTRARSVKGKYELYNAESGEWETVKRDSHLYDWVWLELLNVSDKKEGKNGNKI